MVPKTYGPVMSISRRKRGMFDKFIAKDLDADGDIDILGTRGNSQNLDGGSVRADRTKFQSGLTPARSDDSQSMPLPQ